MEHVKYPLPSQIIGHRYPFIWVDRILELRNGEFVRAIKNVSFNEKIFKGHFPKKPIFPAVIIIEALCQCAQIMLGSKLAVTAKLESFKFLIQVEPGMQLDLQVKCLEKINGFQKTEAIARVNGRTAAKGIIIGCEID
jgi:3-hydroxyacyl-[acyl-carrier-protein] dehydratase